VYRSYDGMRPNAREEIIENENMGSAFLCVRKL